MSDFVHLHLHSEYSLLDGACKIADIPKKAKAMGQSAVAITDHGNMFGVVEFYKAAKKAGDAQLIKYITTGEWDEEEAQFNRKDIKSNNGRKEYQTTRNEKQTTKESVLGHSEGSRWGDISYTVERGRIRVLSEVVRGGKELQKIKAFAKSFYTKRRL